MQHDVIMDVSPVSSLSSFSSESLHDDIADCIELNPAAQIDYNRSPALHFRGRPCPTDHINDFTDSAFVKRYSKVLRLICETNRLQAYLPDRLDKISIFYSSSRQPFTLDRYVMRIVTFANCSRSVFIIALVYIDRLKRSDPRLAISELNVHRILITAILLAMKFVEDEIYPNSYLAKVGGIATTAELVRKRLLRLFRDRC